MRTRLRPWLPCLEALEGRSLLSFYAPINYAVGERPYAIAVGDFNGDPRPDLVVANVTSNTVSVLLANADGSFQPARSFATGAAPSTLMFGDFNGDGRNDLVTIDDVGLSLLLGNGDGTLQPARTIGDAAYRTVATGDLTGDGRFDLVANDHDRVSLFPGNGDGTFGAAQTIPLPDHSPPDLGGWPLPQYPLSVDTVELNADGRLDLAVAAETVHTVTDSYLDQFGNLVFVEFEVHDSYLNLLLNNGDGTFTPADPEQIVPNDPPDSGAPVPNDFNQDGRYDIVSTAYVSLGNADGGFGPPVYFAAGDNPAGFVVGDFNGDGFPDLAVTNAGSDDVSILLNTRDWRSFVLGGFPAPATAGEARSITVAALDGTGNPLPTYTGTVHFTSTDPQAVLPADYTFTAADGGTHTFAVTMKTAGYQIVAVTDVVTTGPTGSQIVRVDPAATSRFVIGFPADVAPGVPGWLTVSAQDAYGNATPEYRGTVHFTSSDPAAVLPADYPFSPSRDAGSVRLSAELKTLGTHSITVTDTAHPSTSGSRTGIRVLPAVGINDVTVTEGNSGTRVATFTVTLSGAATQRVTVGYVTANGTALAVSDYQATSGTITFAPGETSRTVVVLVNGDRLGEPHETFFVNLSNSTNALITDEWGVGTVLDDEPRISISDVTRAEGGKGQTTLFVFTVTLSAAYDQPVTMSYRTVNGTANAGEDYTAKSGTITFAPGETTKTITIEIKADSKKEANETFYLDLFGNSLNSLITKNRGLGTIQNDD
jgi:hypothetical protein